MESRRPCLQIGEDKLLYLNQMKQTLLLLILIFSTLAANSQSKDEKKIIAHLSALESATTDTSKVRLMCSLSKLYRTTDIEKSVFYANNAIELAQKTKDKYFISKAIAEISSNKSHLGKYSEAILYAKKALEVLQADTVNYINNKYLINLHLAQIYIDLGMAYDFNSQYAPSIKYYLKALDLFQLIKHREGQAVASNNLGISYLYADELDKSEKYFQETFDIYMSLKDTSTAYQAKMNLAIIDYYEGDFDRAIAIFKETEVMMRKIGNTRSLGNSLTNLGEVYKEDGRYDSAQVYITEAIEIDKELQDFDGLASDYFVLGDIYLLKGNLALSRKYIIEGIEISKKIARKNSLKEGYEKLYELELKSQNYKEALENYVLFTAYNDTIKKESNSSKLGKIEAENEFNKKMAVKEIENAQNLKIEEEKRNRQTVILYFTIAIMLVVLIFVFMVWKAMKIAKQQKELVQLANIQIEEKNHELTDSIRYAKRIQLALLKDDDMQSSNLPEYFILFEPKDIVSGDFYWTFNTEKYWYMAAADCTGHGVPGAMLTMLGTAYLNEICSSNEQLSPAQLLDQLKSKITKELSQTGTQGESKDGMDMSVIRMNKSSREIEWAGANNPMYQISNNELIEIKPDKQPIGYSDNVQPFTNHKVDVKTGDSIYLFSDGFADQFGGENLPAGRQGGKKYKYSNFKKIIRETNSLTPSAQKEALFTSFKNWQGKLEQLDDVCVIGIRL